MPLPRGGKLSTPNVDKVVKHLHDNPQDKDEAIQRLREKGFRATVEEVFELDQEQKTELERTVDGDFEDICRRATIFALERGGKIEYRHEGHSPPNMMAQVYCRAGVLEAECGVIFIC
jgi:hypothetical protein